jgi:hypothetical protein
MFLYNFQTAGLFGHRPSRFAPSPRLGVAASGSCHFWEFRMPGSLSRAIGFRRLSSALQSCPTKTMSFSGSCSLLAFSAMDIHSGVSEGCVVIGEGLVSTTDFTLG